MLHDAVLLEDLVEDCSGRPPSTMKFSEMISNQSTTGFLLEDVAVVRNAQADADSVFGEAVKAIRGHVVLLERQWKVIGPAE